MSGDRVIGGYVLRRVLGRGGMGEVHLAATPTGGLAAVKLIHPELARDPAFRRRFEREVAAARRVARFCTAPVLDAGLDGDTAYLVTEYVKGPDLAQAVRDQGPLSGSNLEALAVGIATALSAIHGAGVIHRDLKPSNVLLSPLGPRVIDFGIAQLVDESQISQSILGTPAFMAPEQVRGEPLSPATDVYSWGGVIAFAGTGRLPFGGGAPAEVLYRIVNEGPALDGLDHGLREVVEHAMAKRPHLRPTAQQLLEALVGGGRLTPATATQVVERTWTGPVTHPAPTPRSDGRVWPGVTRADGPGGSEGAVRPEGAVRLGGPGGGRGAADSVSERGRSVFGVGAEGRVPASDGAGAGGGDPVVPDDENGTGRVGRRWWHWGVGVVVALGVAGAVALSLVRPESWPYEADFRDAWAAGESDAGSAQPVGSEYVLTVRPGWRLWKTAPRPEPGGVVVVSARARLEQGSGAYGVWCHGSGAGGRYEFAVSGAGQVTIVKRLVGREPTILYGPKQAQAAATNRVVAECGQSGGKATLRMWLNERLVAEATDAGAPLGQGESGVHAAPDGTVGLRVRFESFALRPAKS
ncbi:serine/threonine-protein kinase [Nonomuraea sp. NPDC048916]|uniref:serine/threonine-protein kinase n=1 Tax=Nonomuraea sp. NPDC048916 TaxID=3154232 RepID=UPI0033F9C0CE